MSLILTCMSHVSYNRGNRNDILIETGFALYIHIETYVCMHVAHDIVNVAYNFVNVKVCFYAKI